MILFNRLGGRSCFLDKCDGPQIVPSLSELGSLDRAAKAHEPATSPVAADLFCDIQADLPLTVRTCLPGLLVATLAAAAAGFLGLRYDAPITLFALLIGFALNFLRDDRRLAPGLGFASRTLLRWAVVLLGARVTFTAFAALGLRSFLALLVVMAGVILSALAMSRLLRLGSAFGLLAGGAVAICGASAALALSTVIGERRLGKASLSVVLLGIAGASAAAMLIYPTLAHLARLSDSRAGFVLGASIHDVAQAIAGGFAYSPAAGEIATVVKLVRVAMLAPILTLAAWIFGDGAGRHFRTATPPWFVLGFFAICAVNSAGWIPSIAAHGAAEISSAFLAIAIAAAAIQAPLSELHHCGWERLLVIAVASVVALATSIAGCLLLLR